MTMGPEKYGDLSSFRGDQGSNFGSFRELDESDNSDDDEEGEDSDDDEDEDGFEGLNLSNRSSAEIENVGRIEEEVCRLVDLRSGWNPKFEGELRPLLRSLKPRQVCAVLRSFKDELVALKFFYWVDRQWRHRHDAIAYYTMLEVLSKTKLCQGAKGILQLMKQKN